MMSSECAGSLRRTMCLPAVALLFAGSTGVGQQAPTPSVRPSAQTDQVIRSRVELITSDVIVRDHRGMFVADLKKSDFEIYEDGVAQQVITLTLSHGGRAFNLASPPPVAASEGIVLPPAGPVKSDSGRIVFLFVDDSHLSVRQTPRIRELLRTIGRELIHDGDMFGIVSTGTSSVAIHLTYDRSRLNDAIKKIAGGGLTPQEILDAPEGAQGSAEVRHRAHVAFSTAYDILGQLEQIHDRRKAFIYVSSGYDFNPFPESRAKQEADKYGRPPGGDGNVQQGSDPFAKSTYKFGFADLAGELAEVTRAANRANASIYAIDPRGLVAGPDIDDKVDMAEWNRHVQTTQDTLRVLAEQTGGFAIVNQNSFDKGLKRIDAETSDYYVIGYYSSNPDPLKRRRVIEINVKRPAVDVKHRTEYFLKRGS